MNTQGYGYCRGCGQQILWTLTSAGRNMPCDPRVIRFTAGGDETFVTPYGEVKRGTRTENGPLVGYISHFATCPSADRFRRR